jgi:hypothetical protein
MPEDASTAPAAFPFLRLPLELREQIYSLYFKPADHLVRTVGLEAKGFFGGVYQWDFDLWRVNKQVYAEAKKVWKRENIFVKVATPWPSAGMYRVYLMATDGIPEQLEHTSTTVSGRRGRRELLPFSSECTADHQLGVLVNHISSEGLVPIVCTDARADAFKSYHAVVQITAPFHGVVPEHMVVMLVDDLHLFTKTWYYSALSYPMLNERLSTTFVLQNPYAEPSNEAEDAVMEEDQKNLGVSIALQRKLLLPFEHVKGLHSTSIHGFAPNVREELARLQARPIPTLRESLESATDYMLAGDLALASSSHHNTNNTSTSNPYPTQATGNDKTAALEALDLYKKAFHAIHILIHGRTRRVLADDFFHDGITSGRYAGQTGITIRVLLRLKLVSRTIAAYNALGQYGEAAFWGLRSIRVLQESLNPDFENFLMEFLEGSDVGWIYVRSGLAFWQMERDEESWLGELISYADEPLAVSERLWGFAGAYVKPSERAAVRGELLGYGIPQGVVNLFGDVAAGEEDVKSVESVAAENGSSTSKE